MLALQAAACRVADYSLGDRLLGAYRDIAAPVQDALEAYARVPRDLSPAAAQFLALFTPLFCVGALFFHMHGFRGPAKCAAAGTPVDDGLSLYAVP